MSKFKSFFKQASDINGMINASYNNNKTVVKCLTQSNRIKALLSAKDLVNLEGHTVEKACAAYLLFAPDLTKNMPALYLVSSTLHITRAKRIGWRKAIVSETAVDLSLYALNLKELRKPFEFKMKETV